MSESNPLKEAMRAKAELDQQIAELTQSMLQRLRVEGIERDEDPTPARVREIMKLLDSDLDALVTKVLRRV